jgi:D-glycero-alpha-D-manno-heptose-7-phosphate kinase
MKKFLRVKSPLRISFAGGGTDIEPIYREIGGAVLVAAINKYSYVTISPREDRRVVIKSLDMNVQVSYQVEESPAYDGVLDLAKACLDTAGISQGVDISIYTEAPPGSGLGSSSSMITSLLTGLYTLAHKHIDPYDLAEKAYEVERVKMNISGGRQDQYACTFGGFNFIEFSKEKVEVTPLKIRPEILNDLESHCMLCYTGRTRLSASLIDKQVAAFEKTSGQSREGTMELKHLAYQAKETLMRGNIWEFGHLLHQSGISKKKMNPETTDKHIDALYEKARENGTFGGKILGAGGGGYLLLFVPSDKKHSVRHALEELGGQFTTFSFCPDGIQVWNSDCP